MEDKYLRLLFEKYIRKTATAAEKEELLQYISLLGDDDVILKQISEEVWPSADLSKKMPDNVSRKVLDAILFSIGTGDALPETRTDTRSVRMFRGNKIARYAAAVLLLIAGSLCSYLFLSKQNPAALLVLKENKVIRDVMPGRNGAVLTLSNGQSFLIDTLKDEKVATGIVKSGGELMIDSAVSTLATLSTPPGRQQQLLLSDGTKVWLNAGSSIRFPTVFNSPERVVDVTGEVYIEVVHNDTQPFVVRTGTDEIRDIGTRFNVNSYSNEPESRITLLEGSVKINNKVILKPNEQYSGGRVQAVDADASVAWVSGYFNFEHANVQTVMRQIERWYDVEVHYAGKIPQQQFEGQIQRSLKLSEVLELISGTGIIKYSLDGRQLIISQ